jgi:sterol desaturase/sphingolipid hydroxylase (fatty acid hydroxylase superfamily)
MHSDFLWGLHLIHHSSKEMDVVVSSRNSVWTSFFFPYLWLNSLFLFLLDNKVGFVLGVSMTAMLDLWRHSYLTMNPSSTLYKFTSLILHTPIHHSWHHSRSRSRVNFGANISIWDRLFGTYYHSQEFPKDLGFDVKGDLKTKLFHPFKLREENQ